MRARQAFVLIREDETGYQSVDTTVCAVLLSSDAALDALRRGEEFVERVSQIEREFHAGPGYESSPSEWFRGAAHPDPWGNPYSDAKTRYMCVSVPIGGTAFDIEIEEAPAR